MQCIMKIAIPSYNRVSTFKKKTLKLLLENGVDITMIYLFVANDEEYSAYAAEMPVGLNIIVAQLGICNVRNFITDYFNDGETIVCMDDDIAAFKTKGDKSLLNCLHECCTYLETSPYQLIGLPPTYNDYFNRHTGFQTGLFVTVGCFIILKNDRSIHVTEPIVEDLQRTCISYTKYGAVVRYNDLMLRTKPFAAGGLNAAHIRNYINYYAALTKLYFLYPNLVTLVLKKIPALHSDPVPHARFTLCKKVNNVIQFPIIDSAVFILLLDQLKHVHLSIKQDGTHGKPPMGSYRINFPRHRVDVFGLVQNRPINGGGMALSKVSIRRPELYAELMRIGNLIVPFTYSSILINKNTVCGLHKDANNVGLSLVVSIGDYTGCDLVIEGRPYTAKYRPLIFNGSEMQHYNTDDLIGDKYSLVFYNILGTA